MTWTKVYRDFTGSWENDCANQIDFFELILFVTMAFLPSISAAPKRYHPFPLYLKAVLQDLRFSPNVFNLATLANISPVLKYSLF